MHNVHLWPQDATAIIAVRSNASPYKIQAEVRRIHMHDRGMNTGWDVDHSTVDV